MLRHVMTTDPTHFLSARAGWSTKQWWGRLIGISLLLGGAVPLITLTESIETEVRPDCQTSCNTEFSELLAYSVSRLLMPDRSIYTTGYAPTASVARSARQSRQAGRRSGHRLANGLMAPLRN